MFTKGRKQGTVRFAATPGADVQRVHVAGDFNGWRRHAMRKQKTGAFVAVVPVRNGTHEYKFLFDDQWTTDPDNNSHAVSTLGP